MGMCSRLSLHNTSRMPVFAFLIFEGHLIISGIEIAKCSEWDALPMMPNAAAKVTRRHSQGHTATQPGNVGWRSCGGFLWLSHRGAEERRGKHTSHGVTTT